MSELPEFFSPEAEFLTTPCADEDYLKICIEQFGGELELMLEAARNAMKNALCPDSDSIFSDAPEYHLSNIERIIRGDI